MAAARYWRINAIDTYGGDDLELSALHLYDESGRADLGAPLTSSHAPIAGALANLQDSDDTSICRFGGAQVRSSGFFLQWDLGVGGASASGLMFGAATDEEYFLAQCDLSYSNDGVFWTKEGEFNRLIWPGSFSLTPVVKISHLARVVLLLSCDGAHGARDLIDSSQYKKTITTVGGVEIRSTQSKWGGTSAYFDGNNNSYAAIQNSIEFDLASQEFTIEVWLYLIASGPAGSAIFGRWGAAPSTNTDFLLAIVGGKLLFVAGWTTGIELNGPEAFPGGAWVHVAVTRLGNVWTLWQGGVAVATQTSAFAIPYTPLQSLRISRWDDTASFFQGYIDDLRITKGVARYTSDFTPPVSAFSAAVEGTIVPLVRGVPPARALVAASAVVPTFSTRNAGRVATARDTEYGGTGTIYGTTKTKGTPNQPTKARVVLLHQRSKLPVRETWSDPVTGNFAFTGIDTAQQFLTLAEDAAGNSCPVAAGQLTPEVMP